MKPAFYYIRKFLLQIDKNMISFWEISKIILCEINLSKWKPQVDTWYIVKIPFAEGWENAKLSVFEKDIQNQIYLGNKK